MKPRLLFIPLHYDASPRPHEDWFSALSKEFDCDYGEPKSNGNYDYIFMQSGSLQKYGLHGMKSLRHFKVIQWTGDARVDAMENVTQYKGIADLTLLAVGIGQKQIYESALGCPVDYLQQGVFNSFFIKPQQMESGKTVFIGNNYDHFEGAVERAELCRHANLIFENFETIGNGWDKSHGNVRSIPYTDSAKIYNESYISISHACFNNINGYYSNRTIDIMAAGGCCLQRWFPGIENYFTDMYDCVVYRTNDEALEKIAWLNCSPERRNMIAINGHNTAKQKHTFDVRASEVKQLIKKHL